MILEIAEKDKSDFKLIDSKIKTPFSLLTALQPSIKRKKVKCIGFFSQVIESQFLQTSNYTWLAPS